MRGTILSRGIDLTKLDHRDLLDIGYALLLEPLAGDPAARTKFIENELNKPLPGSQKARKQVTQDALAALGISPDAVAVTLAKQEAAAREQANADMDTADT